MELIYKLDLLSNFGSKSMHRRKLTVIRYQNIMVIFTYPFLVVITQLFSLIIFINDFTYILTGSPG